MRRVEPILGAMAQLFAKFLFRADGANGYWAIGVWNAHRYKLAFYTLQSQMCYDRIGQGCTGGSVIYTRMKDIATSAIPKPDPEPALSEAIPCFEYYLDDNLSRASTFEGQIKFLYNYYFPRLVWAKPTLNSKKCTFFVDKVQVLGHQCDNTGICPAEDKLGIFRVWPTPTSKEEVMRFILRTHQIPYKATISLPRRWHCQTFVPDHFSHKYPGETINI